MSAFQTIPADRIAQQLGETPDVASLRMMTFPYYLCVSYEKEADVYQPARIAGVIAGMAVVAGASKIVPGNPMSRVLSTLAGLYLIGYNAARYLEVREEMERVTDAMGKEEKL